MIWKMALLWMPLDFEFKRLIGVNVKRRRKILARGTNKVIVRVREPKLDGAAGLIVPPNTLWRVPIADVDDRGVDKNSRPVNLVWFVKHGPNHYWFFMSTLGGWS